MVLGKLPEESSGRIAVPTPTRIDGVTDAVAISVGFQSACARLSNGTVACGGDNSVGELGSGSTEAPRSGLTASLVVDGP